MSWRPGTLRGPLWLVDDSALDRERTVRALQRSFDVEAFEHGEVMLERLAIAPPAVLLLDLTLPTISGIDLLHFVREQYDEVTLPVLLLSARAELTDVGEGLAAGANDYVAKPFDDVTLLGRVRTLVRVQRLAEESRERELWLHTTLSSIGEGVVATDAAGRILFMNTVAADLIGVAADHAVGRPFSDVCWIEGDGQRAALRMQRDGQRIAVEHTASPIGSSAGQSGVVHVLRDARVARARADFEEKLVGIVSHDLRNPLQTILLGTTALLADDHADEATKGALLRIRRSADRATKLISDVLDFTQARLGNGIPIRPREGNLHALVQDVVDDELAVHPGVRVVLETAGDAAGMWDPERLAQVFANLLSNALKYGAKDRPVTIRSVGDVDGVAVSVHNEGVPISDELAPFMFEPMKRGNDPTDNTSRSVGLGLYIVKHIIAAHGGTIDVASTADGTTFSVRLPRGG